ncbi:MAG TPA: hypothetical protein VIK01_28875 [Polyangiaceae bacterium]
MTQQSVKRLVAGVGASLTAVAWPVLALAAPRSVPASGDDIRDIRPLISIPPWWYWLVAGVAAALIVALVFAGIRYWRRRSLRALTPEQRALQALTAAEALARGGQCREWAEIVAQTLRLALATRLGQDACPETTSELAAVDWSKLPLGATVDAPRLVELLTTCDLTRFALGRLDPSALLVETQSAREWITRLFAAPEATRAEVKATPIEASP